MTTTPCAGPCNTAYRLERRHHADDMTAYQLAVTRYHDALTEWAHTPAGPRPREPKRPDPPTLEATPGDPVWCGRCVGRLDKARRDIEDLAANAAHRWDGYRGAGDGRGNPESPSPSPGVEILDQLYGDLADYETGHRAHMGYGRRADRGRGSVGLKKMIGWLGDEHTRLLRGPSAEAYGRTLLRWRRLLEQLTGLHRDDQPRHAPCPRCDRRALILQDDSMIRCRGCGRAMGEDEYTGLAAAEERREQRRRKTAPAQAPVPAQTTDPTLGTNHPQNADPVSGGA